MNTIEQIQEKIKITESKLKILKGMLDEAHASAPDIKIRRQMEKLLDLIVKTRVVEDTRVAYEDMTDPLTNLAQWFAGSMATRMLMVIKKMFEKGFTVAKIINTFKEITESDEHYIEMNKWLNKQKPETINKVLMSSMRSP